MDREKMREVRWVKPQILCEVRFNEGQIERSLTCAIRNSRGC